MLAHLLPVTIMFLYTILSVSLFCIPITKFPRKNKLYNFYWVGFWSFLVAIAALAGGSNTLQMVGYDVSKTANMMLFGITASFVFFVMFAWFRLSAKAISNFITLKLTKLKS